MIACPGCHKDLAPTGRLRFCSYCGIEIPLSLIFKQRIAEQEHHDKLKNFGFNVEEINPKEEHCDDEYHSSFVVLNEFVGDCDIKFCHQCGKELPKR